jgi:hypothetical protein
MTIVAGFEFIFCIGYPSVMLSNVGKLRCVGFIRQTPNAETLPGNYLAPVVPGDLNSCAVTKEIGNSPA